ncbi:MAG: UDP-N-acetylglucosamine--N-acetylmuramyl-(pentapeptide) pyrophosphoryl-undecaprenol N-acetylglucosamine transferase [Planctomycetota bacterium]|jgi:UDP-N-acetylglucosamine--N-acetylmuramyl-(pentapeptide) pyrophosphoryl-undecaprenol N-acetylglucosamine transferase
MNNGSTDKRRHYIFAGGGTGGHIYPALAVADRIGQETDVDGMLFFCSGREIDARILSKTKYEFLPLPAVGLSAHPKRLVLFFSQFVKSYYFVKHILAPIRHETVVIGTGGFVAAPVVMAARSLKIPIYMINVDIVPGKSNKFLSRFARKVFAQFPQTEGCFKPGRAEAVGCPLRAEFQSPDKQKAVDDLKLDPAKKVLLVTGASSGAMNINNAMVAILSELETFADDWQVVHLTGILHADQIRSQTQDASIAYHVVDYYDDMPSLLAAADIVIGRAGAVSVAEYAAAGKPAICLPYPYHTDQHQLKNAQQLVDAGAAVVVTDNPEMPSQTTSELLETVSELMTNHQKRTEMALAAKNIGIVDAADRIFDSIK